MRILWTALLAAAMTAPVALAAPPREEEIVAARIAEVLDRLEEDSDFVTAEQELLDLFESLIAHATDKQAAAFTDTSFALRLVLQLSQVEDSLRSDLLPFLRENPAFAHALVFAVRPEHEKMEEVYALVDRLRRERGDTLEAHANLAAAIAIVHDKPLAIGFNENRAASPDPIALYDYYLAHEKEMLFPLRDVPAEMLVHTVDVTGTIADLEWAIAKYKGHPAVGGLFFDIQYDYEHYRTGQPKRSTQAGWGLANILQYGGVCADQAYFATHVGKAIGVPTAYTIGRNADVGHAWVGFVQSRGRQVSWNFDAGRYDAYLGLKGAVLDPQTRKIVDDSLISLLAEYSMSPPEARYAAAAFTDAAVHLKEIEEAGVEFAPVALMETANSRRGRLLRNADLAGQLDLLETGLRASGGYARAWFAVRDLAEAGALSLEEKKKWSSVLDRLCGQRYPDFALSILKPMVASIEDIEEQNELWNAAFRNFSGRMDLAAEIRMSQGEMWANAGEINKAGQCYMDVIERFANAGPFVREALKKAEELLINSGRAERIVDLYASTWNRIERPEQMAGIFVVQSNWYVVGMAYAGKLEEAGQAQQAAAVRGTIGGG